MHKEINFLLLCAGRMSDQDNSVRLMATHCFATLIRLLPLEGGVPDPPSLSEVLLQQKRREREFLERLLDPSKIENYNIPLPINAELRSYQQVGLFNEVYENNCLQ